MGFPFTFPFVWKGKWSNVVWLPRGGALAVGWNAVGVLGRGHRGGFGRRQFLGQAVGIPESCPRDAGSPGMHRDDAASTFTVGWGLHPSWQGSLGHLPAEDASTEFREAASVCKSCLLDLGDIP